MPEIDTSNPAEAIRNAVAEDSAGAVGNQAPQDNQQVSPEVDVRATEPQVTTTEDTDSLFKDIDPSKLTPELKSLHDSLRRDYTQKTQTLSEQRKEIEQLGSIDQVRNAIDFMQALQDPANLVQLHGELSEYLQENGLSKQEADQVATESLNEPQDGLGLDTDPEITALKKEIEDMKLFREDFEQQRLQVEIESNLARQETMIRQANPTYTDDDMNSIYERAYAFGGDLGTAQKSFEQDRQRILSSYMGSKETVSTTGISPSVTTGGQAPEHMSFEEAHKYAKQRAAAIDGLGGWDN